MPSPRRSGGRVAVGALCLAVVTLGWSTLDRGPPWKPIPLSSPSSTARCVADGTWSWESGDRVDTASIELKTNAGIVSCTNGPGTLSFVARGTVAGNIGARVVLVHGHAVLLEAELRDGETPFQVDVPAAGTLLLAFVNDRHAPPEDRNLWISGLDFSPLLR